MGDYLCCITEIYSMTIMEIRPTDVICRLSITILKEYESKSFRWYYLIVKFLHQRRRPENLGVTCLPRDTTFADSISTVFDGVFKDVKALHTRHPGGASRRQDEKFST